MSNLLYTLPEDEFMAGSTVKRAWRLFTSTGTPFNADGCVGDFSLTNYSHRGGTPEIIKPLEFKIGENGVRNIASVILTSQETAHLFGIYIYQIMIKDIDGCVEIPEPGIFNIKRNIHTDFIVNK